MMKYVDAARFTASWAFYLVGYVVSLSPIIAFSWGHKLYNWFMLRSDDAQGETPYGPWGPGEQTGGGE